MTETVMFGHDYEPVRGLPAPLPKDESILWQGAPKWETLARKAIKLRVVAVYFALLIAWGVSGGIASHTPPADIAVSALRLSGLGLVAIGVLALFAWMVARTTVYTITTRRVVLRFGIAFPITLQVAFNMINAAGVHMWAGGDGDIAMSVRSGGQRVSYMICWPHVRPWKLARPQPTLRCVPDAAAVAQILGRALAASAAQPAQAMPIATAGADSRAPVPATA